MGALFLFGHPHAFGCLPMCPTAPCICMLPYMSVCSRGYLHVLWGNIPYVWCLGGISTYVRLLVSVSTSIGCPLCFILYPFVVHYVLSLYICSYDYYSSSDCGVFWYVITIISDHGFLFDGASYSAGSA